MAKSFTSRYDTYQALDRLHRGKPIKDIVNSKQWKTFLSEGQNDLTYKVATIPSNMENRADLISLAAFGTDRLWWLICSVNKIIDPQTELIAGKQIKIPIIK
jgi:hypothetical protein